MSPEPSPFPFDTLVESATGDFARVLRGLVGQLEDDHARALQDAVAAARADGTRATEEVTAGLRREFDDERRTLAEQHAADLRDLEARLEAEAALAERTLDAEQRLNAEMRASAAAALAEAEARFRAERDEAVARATAEAEQRLRHDADAALRLAQESFESRLAATAAAPAASLFAPATWDPEPAARADERDARLQMLERVLRSTERLDAAASLRAALDVLAEAVATEAPRSLVWVVRGDRLRGWRASGASDAPAEFEKSDIALPAAGPFAAAVASLQPVSLHANALAADTDGALSWLDLADDQAGLVVPVTVDGHVVALVYADDGASPDRDVPGSWPESVQVLTRHAARVLEILTARRAADARVAPGPARAPLAHAPMTPDEARQVARLVVSEVKLFHEQTVKAGREARDLRMRLAEPLARARRSYDERVPASLAGRDEVFEQELRRTLAEGDPDLLGEPDNATA